MASRGTACRALSSRGCSKKPSVHTNGTEAGGQSEDEFPRMREL